MPSLRTRLALGTAIAMAAVLVAGGLLLYLCERAALLAQLDRSLSDEARLLASTAELDFGVVEVEFEELDMRDFEEPGGPAYLQVWLADGSAAFRSPSLASGNIRRVGGDAESPVCRWVDLPNGTRVRAAGVSWAPRGPIQADLSGAGTQASADEGGEMIALTLARVTTDFEAALGRLRWLLAVTGLVMVTVSVGALYWIIQSGLRPLDRTAVEISRLDASDLSARVSTEGVPLEIRPLTGRLNDLLCRLEEAFRRERSFSADVAHELRTPLAGLRSTVEVALARERSDREYREALDDVLQVTSAMQDVAERLLVIARMEGGSLDVGREQVLLNDLVHACWRRYAEPAERRRLEVDWALGAATPVTTDGGLLELAIRNVIENAVTYADEGGALRIGTSGARDRASVSVCNSGSMLSQDEAVHVFERFWRGDAARTEAGVRAGLGLSVVQQIMEVLGGTARVESRRGGEFRITLSVPVDPAGAQR